MSRRLPIFGISAVILTFVAVACWLALAPRPTSPQPPGIIIESKFLDMGAVDAGVNEFQLPVKNLGSSPVEVRAVQASCGCTTLEKCDTIQAGGVGIIRGKVTVKPGKGSANLSIDIGDSHGWHVFLLTWFGKRPPSLLSPVVRMTARSGEPFQSEVQVIYDAGSELVFKGAAKTKGEVREIRFDVVGTAGKRGSQEIVSEKESMDILTLSLKGRAPMEVGEHASESVLQFRRGDVDYNLPLGLKIDVIGKVHAKPRQVIIGGANRESLVGKTTSVKILTDPVVKNVVAASCPGFLKVAIRRDRANEYHLEIAVVSVPPDDVRSFSIDLQGEGTNELCKIAGRLIYGKSS